MLWNRNFIYFCCSHFFLGLNYYLLAAILPLYIQVYLNGNEFEMGLVITIYVLGSVFARIFSGYIVDYFNKKLIGIIGFGLFLAASISYLGALEGLLLILIIRWIHGMTFALSSTAINSAIVLVLPNGRQGEGIGYFSMFLNLAMVIGPSLGIFLWRDQQIHHVLFVVIFTSLLGLLFMSKLNIPSSDFHATPQFSFHNIIEIKALPLSLVSFCLFFSYSSLAGFLASYTTDLHIESIAGYFFILFGLMILGFRPVVAKMLDHVSPNKLFYPSILFFGFGMLVLSQAVNAWMILFAAILMGISYGLLSPFLQNLILTQVPKSRSGPATVTFFLLSDFGYGAGSYFLGLTASLSNYRMMYICSGVVAILSIFFYWQYFHKKQQQKVEVHA